MNNSLVEVRLHGVLAEEFGTVWHFDIATPKEAVAAIEANSPGFRNRIRELEASGHCFKVKSPTHEYDSADVSLNLGSTKRIDIIPVITGSSAGVRFVIGAALLVVAAETGYYAPGTTEWMLQTAATNVGAGMMLASVAEWLAPKVQSPNSQSLGSWTFAGPSNELGQNQPVPVIYGEVLTGAYPISGGLASSTITGAESIAPAVTLGGQFEVSHSSPDSASTVTVFQIGAGPLNLNDPYTYVWTVTGFSGAVVTLTGQGTATVRANVTVDLAASSSAALTGTVALTMTGRPVGSTDTTTTSVSTSQALTLHTDNLPYPMNSDASGWGG